MRTIDAAAGDDDAGVGSSSISRVVKKAISDRPHHYGFIIYRSTFQSRLVSGSLLIHRPLTLLQSERNVGGVRR